MNRFFLLTIGALLSGSTVVSAQEPADAWDSVQDDPTLEAVDPSYPVSFSRRPLTLPRLHVRADVVYDATHWSFGAADETVHTMTVGGAFGITDDLEVGLGVPPIGSVLATLSLAHGFGGTLAPEIARGFVAPQLYGRGRFVASESFELGGQVGVLFPANGSDAALSLSAPMRVRAGSFFALDVVPFFLAIFGEDGAGDLDPTFAVGVNLMPRIAADVVYFGVDTGFLLDVDFVEDTHIPLFFEVGATFPMGENVLDLFAHGGLPLFAVPGSDGDKIVTELWSVQLGARVHLGFQR